MSEEIKEFETSSDVSEYNKAMHQHFGRKLAVSKTEINPHFKSTYANLESVKAVADGPLYEAGFYREQFHLGGIEACRLLTRITHVKSNQYKQWLSTWPIESPTPQKMKSALTYSRRTNITTTEGLSEEDDDGNVASSTSSYQPSPHAVKCATGAAKPQYGSEPQQNPNVIRRTPVTAPDVKGGPSEKQLKRLFAITKHSGYEPYEVDQYIVENFGGVSKTQLSRPQYDELCSKLENKLLDLRSNGQSQEPVEDSIPF